MEDVFPIQEVNVVKKDWRRVGLRVALCYPNVYRVGMSGFTVQLLYALFNAREDAACERFFLPTKREPLLSLESHQPLNRFDVIAFTFQYEEDYVNALRMLMDSRIVLDRAERAVKPLLVAGGPCITENPAPLKDFFDLFVVGEAEPILDELIGGIKQSLADRTVENFDEKLGFLTPTAKSTTRVWLKSLDGAPHPVAQVVPDVDTDSPYMPVFGRTLTVEVVRGCQRGCKFCLIGHVGKPKRERSLGKIEEIVKEGVKYTGVSKVTLIGAGVADHSRLEDICEYVAGEDLEISVPSLNVESVTERLVKSLVKGKQRTITLAPEAGSERLRKAVDKPMSDERILEAAKTVLRGGIRSIKLYFIVGLPSEGEDDVEAIIGLSKKLADLGFGYGGVKLSINPLIPKPHTPFQFQGYPSTKYLREVLRRLEKEARRDPRLETESLDLRKARIQAMLSLGDSKLAAALRKAAEYGGSLGSWRRALREESISVDEYLAPRKAGLRTPWSCIKLV